MFTEVRYKVNPLLIDFLQPDESPLNAQLK